MCFQLSVLVDMLNKVETVYKFDQMLTMSVTCIINMDVKVPRYHDSAPERRRDLKQTSQNITWFSSL